MHEIKTGTGSALVGSDEPFRNLTGKNHTHTIANAQYETTATYSYTYEYQPSSPTKLVDVPIQNYGAHSNPDVGWVVENPAPRKITYKDYGGP